MPPPAPSFRTAETLFLAAVAAVQPAPLIRKNVRRAGNQLMVAGSTFDLSMVEHIYVVGAGKATAPMAAALEELLGEAIADGIIIVKYGHTAPLRRIRMVEAAHPVPDENGLAGTRELVTLVEKAGERDLVICLLSGGGSALLIDAPPGCALSDVQPFFGLLLASGVDIAGVNTVRKHLSTVKGGGLARAAFPARVVSLILSDVIGDPLDVIASGPTVADPTTFADALRIVEQYGLAERAPAALLDHLQKGHRGAVPETPKAAHAAFAKTVHYLIGSNRIALEAARAEAERLGFHARIITDRIAGEAREVAGEVVREAKRVAADDAVPKPVCLLWGGETTVTLGGAGGRGGRNQELALAAALLLENEPGITLLSGGTDGTDGPTDAAGAVVGGHTAGRARAKGILPEDYLAAHDSYHFFRQAGGHLVTGPTLTNVMDIIVVLVE
jgi:hydroxypyruvate reductase